jgi:tetratricopeptide (TPR) repeat protein
MAKPDALFLLIKSLNPGEKALVRQTERGQSGYLALFDVLSRQKELDERKAKKKLTDLGFEINIAYAKNYLTKHILRTLRENEVAGPNSGNQIVHEIDILMRRRVYDLAEKMLEKAQAKTQGEERFHDFLLLTGLQMNLLLQNGGDRDTILSEIQALNAARRDARESLKRLGEYEDLYFSYRPIVRHKQSARNEWDLATIKEFAAHPLLQGEYHSRSARLKRMHLLCTSMIHAFLGEYTEAGADIQALVDLYRSVAYLRDDHPDGFLNDLWRLGGMKLHFGEFGAVQAILKEIKDFSELKGIHESDIFEKYQRLLLGFALQTKNYKIFNAELPAIRAGLELHGESIPWTSQAMLLLWVARLHFEQGQYKEAKQWLNMILDHPHRGQREDIHSLSRIMLIIIYFETGEADLTESQSKATRKFLQRREALYGFERCILRFLEEHSFAEKGPGLKSALEKLRGELKTIFQDPLEANFLAYFDIMAWLDAKISGKK